MVHAPDELARLEERRQAEGTADVALEAVRIAGGVMSYSTPGCWSNQAVALGLDGPVDDADLDRLVAFYRERDAVPRIEVASEAHPSLLEGLAARGFTLLLFDHVLERPLDADEDLRALHPHGWPAGLELRTLDPADGGAVDEWVDASTLGFRPPGEPLGEGQRAITARMARHPECVCLTAFVDGELAGGGACSTHCDHGALFGASVGHAFRRRGVQLALMLARLEALRARGARFVTVGSEPGVATTRNARRLGFTLGYTKATLVQQGAAATR